MTDLADLFVASTPLDGTARAIEALAPALRELERDEAVRSDVRRAAERGYFTPEEDERIGSWFARYLTARSGLAEIIAELRPLLGHGGRLLDEDQHLRAFVLAYAAASVMVRAARYVVDELAADPTVQRKLNEARPGRRIPRKQYTAIYRSLTHPANAWALSRARRSAAQSRDRIDALADDPGLAPVIACLRDAEGALDVEPARYVKARLRYRWHAWRRRRASAVQQGTFALLEGFGRVVADIRPPWLGHRVRRRAHARLLGILRPGDVLITRHDRALTNLFLPGYWPHAALFIGPEETKRRLRLDPGDEHAQRWVEPRCVLEARKDGVLFRPLPDTLAVDAVAVIRPRLEPPLVEEGLVRAIGHEGKLYNFDFDFFRADRLVCTEVVYRAFDGLGPITIPLTERGGRPTLSAEDLLGRAVAGEGFDPIAVYGSPGARRRILVGRAAHVEIAKTLGKERD